MLHVAQHAQRAANAAAEAGLCAAVRCALAACRSWGGCQGPPLVQQACMALAVGLGFGLRSWNLGQARCARQDRAEADRTLGGGMAQRAASDKTSRPLCAAQCTLLSLGVAHPTLPSHLATATLQWLRINKSCSPAMSASQAGVSSCRVRCCCAACCACCGCCLPSSSSNSATTANASVAA